MKKETMKKRRTKIGAAALAMALLLQSSGGAIPVIAAGSQSQTQMSSDPETVYVNIYNDATVRSQDFNSSWKFYLGDAGNAQEVAFDDSRWDQVNLPHDYSIDQPYSSSMEGESAYLPGGTGWYRKHFTLSEDMKGKDIRIDFDGVYMNSTVWVNGTQLGIHPYGYTPFSYDITDYVKFGEENVITVKVEHRTPSSRWYSGSGINRDVMLVVTDPVHVDLNGVKVTTPNLESEVAAKSAITMNVKTTVANAGSGAADVVLTHTVFEKDGDASKAVGTVTTPSASVPVSGKEIDAQISISKDVKLWSVDSPNLYTVRTEVKVGGKVVDTYDTDYGFRYFKYDADEGFSLNGVHMKLNGVCMHHDQGSLGAVAVYRAIERQVEILKEMGCNAIRTSHNPASRELIEICNKKGMLLQEEIFDGWGYAKNGNTNDYSTAFAVEIDGSNQIIGGETGMTWAEFDIGAAIGRDYNAPAIIMWSVGNEIWTGVQSGIPNDYWTSTCENLAGWVGEQDDTRPVTMGDNQMPYSTSDSTNSFIMSNTFRNSAGGGVIGINYGSGSVFDTIHRLRPEWPLYRSESVSPNNSRGIYNQINITGNAPQTSSKQLTSYDYACVSWGTFASQELYDIITRDYAMGQFAWTGFDYLGEPTPWNGISAGAQGSWPSPKNSYFGIIDTAGFPKDSYYLYQSQWNDKVNTLHILPAWNEDVVATNTSKGGVPVVVYSDARSVELFFTPAGSTEKKSLGKKTFTEKQSNGKLYTYQIYEGADKDSTVHRNLYLTWYVPFEAGTITAVGYDANGNEIKNTQGRSFVTTTGDEAKLKASADRTEIKADGKDLVYVTVDVTDKDGNIVPDASNRVKIKVSGNGELAAVDNGSAPDHDSFRLDNRQAFSGKMLAIVRSTKTAGSITITAEADGLESSSVTVKTTAVSGGTATGDQIDSFYMTRNYYVKTGNMPQLPSTIEAHYTNNTKKNLAVKWDSIDKSQISKIGSFTVNGVVADQYPVSVIVNMIDNVAALLNYSATTPVGMPVVLPDSRPAVMQDGTILDAAFQITWEKVDESVYDQPGIVTIKGTSKVLGKNMEVTATVRVQSGEIHIGDSVSSLATELTQNIEGSDNLEAVRDGVAVPSDLSSKDARWSNYDAAKAGTKSAELSFWYLAPQSLGEVVIYFYEDGWASKFPEKGQVEIYVSESEDGNWTKVNAQESIGATLADGKIRPHTYSFAPVTGTYIKVRVTSQDGKIGDEEICTAITEIELKDATSSLVTNKTAALSSLKVNGVDASAAIAAGQYSTPAIIAMVEAAGADNASVTVLPDYNEKILIFIESEDHAIRNQFVINLNQPASTSPDDDGNDYPYTKTKATAGTEYQSAAPGDGPASYAVDNDEATWWHTNWSGSPETTYDDLWITLELDEATELDALRYLPRSGSPNGRVTGYKIDYSMDGQSWTKIAEGTWESSSGWKIAEFDNKVTAKFVRLTGVHTDGDTAQDSFMSATEVRVRRAVEQVVATDISDPANGITASLAVQKVELPSIDINKPAQPEVTLTDANGAKLEYGKDYIIKYVDNDKFGTASVIIQGILNYSGAVTLNFEIVKVKEDIVLPYKDVNKSDWFYSYVEDVYQKGLMTGLNKTTFGGGNTLVRAQFATILYRMEGEPKVAYSKIFNDVEEKQFYTEPVLWAASKDVKVVTGYTNGNFGPNDQITREQMALMMYRYAQYKNYDTTAREELSKFPDNSAVSSYAKTAMQWCVAEGIISGQGASGQQKMLNPQGSTSRAECATIISRFAKLYE